MFRVLNAEADATQLCNGVSRRELLRIGGLAMGGLTLPQLLAGSAQASPTGAGKSFGRAKACILLYMVGGPPQHETFDPKPDASAEIRGPYKAISTPVDGLQVGELMPNLAKLAQKYAVIRTAATDVNAHTGSGFFMLTGHPNANLHGESTPPHPVDWPTLASVVKRLIPAKGRDLPAAVVLPELVKNNPAILVAGQNSGFMTPEYDPFFLECDPHLPNFQVPGVTPLGEVGYARLDRRKSLLSSVNDAIDAAHRGVTFRRDDAVLSQAFDLVTSDRTRKAFDLTREPQALRDKYGMHKYGQSCLLARRLIESGSRLVTVNWPREPGDSMVVSPLWDTHDNNAGRLKNALMPPMDQGTAALLEDLDQRGLLDETLVVWMGEFGRSPKHNFNGGRDHWGHCFSVMMAGGGIKGGVVHGASDALGAYPDRDRVGPEDLHATIHHCLGLAPETEITDRLGRPLRACEGTAVKELLL